MIRRAILLLVIAASLPAVGSDDIMLDRLNRFNESMRDFAGKLRQHTFDLRQAKLLSKLWHDVETSGEWPQTESK